MAARKKTTSKPINLALQGGGAHGAFAWGVCDRLLEEPERLSLNAMTATSAGAMNAVCVAYGLHKKGPEGAREVLENFWRLVSRSGQAFSLFDFPLANVFPYLQHLEQTATYMTMEALNIAASPYQLNPLGLNPLKDVLQNTIDFAELQKCEATELFISATNVRTGKGRIFRNKEMSVDAVLASACLPQLFQAVEIEGEAYWDGGYMGNPSLWPLFYETGVTDLLVCHINPIERPDIPKTPTAISNRVNEITFNSALLKEMRAIAFVQRLIKNDWLTDDARSRLSDIRFHSIRADDVFADLSVATKFDTSWDFLTTLRDRGRVAAESWLEGNYDKVGKESSVNLHEEFLEL